MIGYADPSEVPHVMHTKLPATVMVLEVVSNERHVMPSHFFPQGLRVNAAAFIVLHGFGSSCETLNR